MPRSSFPSDRSDGAPQPVLDNGRLNDLLSRLPPGYDPDFYAAQVGGSLASAERILPLVFEIIRPDNVLDVGCGVGTWLAVAKRLGVDTVLGLDGHDQPSDQLLIDADEFGRIDLGSSRLAVDRHFDLAISLEVAEHLEHDTAMGLVEGLCGAADVVLFSAAIPAQLGTNHINLRPQSAWADRFAAHGFEAFDVIRPQIWSDDTVDYWYRQNVLMYVNAQRRDLADRARERTFGLAPIVDIVHPELAHFWMVRATRPVSTKQALRQVVRSSTNAMRRRFASMPTAIRR